MFTLSSQKGRISLFIAGVSLFTIALTPVFAAYDDDNLSVRQDQGDVVQAKIQDVNTEPVAGAYTFPENTILRLILLTGLTSKTAFKGQLVEARVSQPVYVGTTQVLGPEDRLVGHVSASLAPREGQNGLIGIQFDQLILDNTFQYPVFGSVLTYQNHTYFGGEGTDGTQPERVLYRNAGMPDYDGFVLRGSRSMGTDLVFHPGDFITLQLEKPLKIYRPNE